MAASGRYDDIVSACHLYASNGWVRVGVVYAVKVGADHVCERFTESNISPASGQAPTRKGDTVPLKIFTITNTIITVLGFLCVTCPVRHLPSPLAGDLQASTFLSH